MIAIYTSTASDRPSTAKKYRQDAAGVIEVICKKRTNTRKYTELPIPEVLIFSVIFLTGTPD